MEDVPIQAVEVEKFSPHSYDHGDQVHLIMPEETLILTFKGEKNVSEKHRKKYGRLAECKFASDNKIATCMCGQTEYSVGDTIQMKIRRDQSVKIEMPFGPIEKILLICAN